MPLNAGYDREEIKSAIAKALDDFYTALIRKVDTITISHVMKRKNPYLFRAKAMRSASQIVEAILSAFISSSEETIFGNAFFEPIATVASGGKKAIAEGIDINCENESDIVAIAVKSGTNVFNSSSRKKQDQNFQAAFRLSQQVHKRFTAIVGYGYGKKRMSPHARPRIYTELAGQDFWAELTGDSNFYIELIKLMSGLPERYIETFNAAYQNASNRLVRDFTNKFCLESGSIDWERLVKYNSGNKG